MAEAKRDEKAIKMITSMYNGEKYYDNSYLKSHCTNKLLNKLRADYEYDCETGDCLAGWDFRSPYQDGPSDKYGIISVKALGDDWYRYDFYDMGNRGANKVKIIEVDGKLLFDEIISLR